MAEDVNSVLRDQAFYAIGESAAMVESYGRSIMEAAYRGQDATVGAHLNELRLCCVEMIKNYNDYLRRPHGQGVAETAGSSYGNREDQQLGDGDARA